MANRAAPVVVVAVDRLQPTAAADESRSTVAVADRQPTVVVVVAAETGVGNTGPGIFADSAAVSEQPSAD